jgi:hypothetical protein
MALRACNDDIVGLSTTINPAGKLAKSLFQPSHEKHSASVVGQINPAQLRM